MNIDKYKKLYKYIIDNNYDEITSELLLEYYEFTKNFSNYIGINQYAELSPYHYQVVDYLNKTFPYCFMRLENQTLEETIELYVISLGGTKQEVPLVIDKLKQTKMQHIDRNQIRQKLENQEIYNQEEFITLNNIVGTTVPKYQLSNLYETLESINDKNINSYIKYLIVNNVFEDEKHFQKVFKGISLYQNDLGNNYINEGNHRIFTYIALLKIREILKINTNSSNYQVNAMMYKNEELLKERQR